MEDHPLPEEDTPQKPDLLPDNGNDVLEITFRPIPPEKRDRRPDETGRAGPVAHCPSCGQHVTVQPDGTCPLGHKVR